MPMRGTRPELSGVTMMVIGADWPLARPRTGSLLDVAQGDGFLQVAEAADFAAGDLDDLVAHLKVRLPGGLAGNDLPDAGRDLANADR